MILVENRELLIPNNERYIGTTQDSESENRLFRIRRVSQSGVDMANLTFRLDLKYPEGRTVYSFDTSSSRTGRIVMVNVRAWTKQYSDAGTYVFTYNGTNWMYAGQAVDLNEIGVQIYFTPSSGDTVTVTVTVTQATGDTVLLDKEATDDYINLTWTVTASQLNVPGSVLISLRGSDETATVRWASFQATIFVEQNGYMPGDYDGKLSELEQLENALSQDIAVIEEQAQKSIAYGDEAEAWAVGTRSGIAVGSGDETYHNNSKYYAQQASASEANAASSASAAGISASQSADSAAAASTSETNAAASETASATSAANAADSAAAASTSENNAAASESSAQTSATNASGSAASASTSAASAETSAINAAGSATEAQSAAALAKKYRDEAQEKIDDDVVSTASTYSSSKITSVIAGQWTTVHTW